MANLIVFVFATVALSLLASATRPPPCPLRKVAPMSNMNHSQFLNKMWYAQQVMPVVFQRKDDAFCQRDYYTMDGTNGVSMQSYWNKGAVDGTEKQILMHGIIEDLNEPSHMLVGFKPMPRFMRGPYWVIAAGPSPDRYDWMIVSGGEPRIQGRDGKCKTGRMFNYSGLWLFTSLPIPGPGVITTMRSVLTDLGYDLSVLINVEHRGCDYSRGSTSANKFKIQ